MSYFETTDGTEIARTTTFENSGLSKVIPNNTQLLCCVSGAEWIEQSFLKNGDEIPRHIKIQLHIIQPGEFKDELKDHKLHVDAIDSKKADKARKFLAAYDELAGGKLRSLKNPKQIEDSRILHRALAGVELIATFGLIEGNEYTTSDGEVKKGRDNNWVMKIAPKPEKLQEEDKRIMAQKKNQPNQPEANDYDDDDIPF